jgi:hypothetical protein
MWNGYQAYPTWKMKRKLISREYNTFVGDLKVVCSIFLFSRHMEWGMNYSGEQCEVIYMLLVFEKK